MSGRDFEEISIDSRISASGSIAKLLKGKESTKIERFECTKLLVIWHITPLPHFSLKKNSPISPPSSIPSLET